MKNTQILATFVAVPLLGIASFASADFDCTTLDREEVKSIMDKQRNGDTLTSDETLLLTNAQSCKPTDGSGSTFNERKMRFGSGQNMPERTGSGMMMKGKDGKMGSWQTLTEQQKAQMEQVHTIITKKQNGETLTWEEQAILDAHQATMNHNQETKTTQTWVKKQATLSNNYKNAIDKKIQALIKNEDSDTDKIQALEAFASKISTLKTKLSSSEMTESKKTTFQNIIDYLLQSIDTEISNINSVDETDDLLDGLLN